MKTISSKVSEKELKAFSKYAEENGITVSRLIRKLLCEIVDIETYSCPFRRTHTTYSIVRHLHNHN